VSDLGLALIWLAVLGSGLGGCVFLHHIGLETSHARDLLHVGTGVWVLGWPAWHGTTAPLLIVVGAALVTALAPVLAPRIRALEKIVKTFSNDEERWAGLVLYTLSYALFTALGLAHHAFTAGAGLLALSLGDGVGGAVGSRFGRHRFPTPLGKPKSVEGSLTVAIAASLGVALAAARFGVTISFGLVLGLGLCAALVEAFSPRASDNVVVPTAVFALAELAS
jgi:dolichol kinase